MDFEVVLGQGPRSRGQVLGGEGWQVRRRCSRSAGRPESVSQQFNGFKVIFTVAKQWHNNKQWQPSTQIHLHTHMSMVQEGCVDIYMCVCVQDAVYAKRRRNSSRTATQNNINIFVCIFSTLQPKFANKNESL